MDNQNWTLGTDVSSCQGARLDWKAIAATRWTLDGLARAVNFAVLRTGEGLTPDKTYDRNWDGVRDAGLLLGSYWAFHPELDPEAQARRYFELAGTCDLPPTIDWELCDGVAHTTIIARALAFLHATETLWKRPCTIYTGKWYWTAIGSPTGDEFASRALWIAQYGLRASKYPDAWAQRDWTLWQFDGDGGLRLPGVDADFDWWPGDRSSLDAWCDKTGRDHAEDETGPVAQQEFTNSN